MLPFSVMELRYYLASDGQSPLEGWYFDLEIGAAAKVSVALARLELGNLSNAKAVGEGVLESRIGGGPGTGSISDGMVTRW